MKKQNDTISRAAVLELIQATGGCDAQDQYGKGWDAACDALYESIKRMPKSQEKSLIEERIYRPIPGENENIEEIENALGFRLFVWQKTYLSGQGFRRYGKTTVECLQVLLESKEPLKFHGRISIKDGIFLKELRGIKEKLDTAGIETRDIIWR